MNATALEQDITEEIALFVSESFLIPSFHLFTHVHSFTDEYIVLGANCTGLLRALDCLKIQISAC